MMEIKTFLTFETLLGIKISKSILINNIRKYPGEAILSDIYMLSMYKLTNDEFIKRTKSVFSKNYMGSSVFGEDFNR